MTAVTTTDEILALAASATGAASGSGDAVAAALDNSIDVTEADIAAFGAAAGRGADSSVVRALLAVRPAEGPWAPPPAAPSRDPAWNAWLTAAAATAAVDVARTARSKRAGGPARPAWLAVFAAGTALSRDELPVATAVAAGLSAAAVIESGLADWGGWSSGTVAAAIGASVTAGLLLGLTPAQLRAALGIAATQAAGLAAAEATPAFALEVGKAAFNGVEAALLARAGLTAPHEPLDGRRGLFALFG